MQRVSLSDNISHSYGTAVEHHSLYQYQFSGAKDIVAGFIQTETP